MRQLDFTACAELAALEDLSDAEWGKIATLRQVAARVFVNSVPDVGALAQLDQMGARRPAIAACLRQLTRCMLHEDYELALVVLPFWMSAKAFTDDAFNLSEGVLELAKQVRRSLGAALGAEECWVDHRIYSRADVEALTVSSAFGYASDLMARGALSSPLAQQRALTPASVQLEPVACLLAVVATRKNRENCGLDALKPQALSAIQKNVQEMILQSEDFVLNDLVDEVEVCSMGVLHMDRLHADLKLLSRAENLRKFLRDLEAGLAPLALRYARLPSGSMGLLATLRRHTMGFKWPCPDGDFGEQAFLDILRSSVLDMEIEVERMEGLPPQEFMQVAKARSVLMSWN